MQKKYINWILILVTLLVGLVFTIILALCVGEQNYTLAELTKIIYIKTGMDYTIISEIRLPRIILGLSIGGALSISGLILQGVYRNPLVEPYTLGISGGAALGVVIAIFFNLNTTMGSLFLTFSGFIGSISATFLVYFLSLRKRHLDVNKMLLIGVMISFISSSMIMLLMSITTKENINSILFWTMGSLDETNKYMIKSVWIVSFLGLLLSYLFANTLNALKLGMTSAKHLGIDTGKSIAILFIIASILTGMSVSVAGVIGFVGLIIPHTLRIIIGSDHRILIPASFLGGGIFIILCDVISRKVISPNQLPIGVISGIIGGFVFIFLISRTKVKTM